MKEAEELADAAVLRPEQFAAGRWQQCHATCSVVWVGGGGGASDVLGRSARCLCCYCCNGGPGQQQRCQWRLLNSGTVTLECSSVYSVSVGVFMFMPCAARGLHQALVPCSNWHLQPWSKGGCKWGCLAVGKACVLTAIAIVFDQILCLQMCVVHSPTAGRQHVRPSGPVPEVYQLPECGAGGLVPAALFDAGCVVHSVPSANSMPPGMLSSQVRCRNCTHIHTLSDW